MSIVGCYSLDLYCDNGGDQAHDWKVSFPHQFTGETASTCRKQARERGWKLDLVNYKAYCPRCVKAGKFPKETS